MDISLHHPGAAQDFTFHDKPRLNSIGYALELSVLVLICGDGAYVDQTANHIITECPLYLPPSCLHGMIDVHADGATRVWLLSMFPDI